MISSKLASEHLSERLVELRARYIEACTCGLDDEADRISLEITRCLNAQRRLRQANTDNTGTRGRKQDRELGRPPGSLRIFVGVMFGIAGATILATGDFSGVTDDPAKFFVAFLLSAVFLGWGSAALVRALLEGSDRGRW